MYDYTANAGYATWHARNRRIFTLAARAAQERPLPSHGRIAGSSPAGSTMQQQPKRGER